MWEGYKGGVIVLQIIKELTNIPHLTIALGFFDGVHLAHQKLIQNAVDFAIKNGTKSAVVTLKQQPYCFLHNISPRYILSRNDSFNIIGKLGIDYLIELDFEKISEMTSYEYLKDILVKYFSPVGIFTGFNHHFGLNREGNCDFLKKYAPEFGYKFFSLSSQKMNNELISSSAIRDYLEKGDIKNANLMLGREFFVSGTVIDGNKIGRTINFPTANMNYPSDIIQIPNGVYSVKAEFHDGRILKGISNFGIKPTFNNSAKILETHILDGFDEDIYGRRIKIHFLSFIRPEQKFGNIIELQEQIKKDIKFWHE